MGREGTSRETCIKNILAEYMCGIIVGFKKTNTRDTTSMWGTAAAGCFPGKLGILYLRTQEPAARLVFQNGETLPKRQGQGDGILLSCKGARNTWTSAETRTCIMKRIHGKLGMNIIEGTDSATSWGHPPPLSVRSDVTALQMHALHQLTRLKALNRSKRGEGREAGGQLRKVKTTRVTMNQKIYQNNKRLCTLIRVLFLPAAHARVTCSLSQVCC